MVVVRDGEDVVLVGVLVVIVMVVVHCDDGDVDVDVLPGEVVVRRVVAVVVLVVPGWHCEK